MYIVGVLIALLFVSCKKDDDKKWAQRSVDFHQNSSYDLINNSETSENNLYEIIPGDNIVFFELQERRNFSGQVTKLRGLGLEIPVNSNSSNFEFLDQQIYDSLKAQGYYYDVNSHENFCRIRKGWIKGVKINDEWEISYDVLFGEQLEFFAKSK